MLHNDLRLGHRRRDGFVRQNFSTVHVDLILKLINKNCIRVNTYKSFSALFYFIYFETSSWQILMKKEANGSPEP